MKILYDHQIFSLQKVGGISRYFSELISHLNDKNIELEFSDYIFIVKKDHNIKNTVLEYYPTSKVIEIDYVTEGAACSVLLADPYVEPDDAIFITNCDQIIYWDIEEFKNKVDNDGTILTFDCPEKDPKWSFAQLNDQGFVTRVAEKDPISTFATTGHYYFKQWKIFKDSVKAMIAANDRVNNEFYLCPSYNYTINLGYKVVINHVNEMHGIGTPEDLETWLKFTNKK